MQKWRVQAEKSNVIILEEGKCQLCGSRTTKGIGECFEKAAYISHRFSHDEGIRRMSLFLCVDAFALQHPETQRRWSVHLHLARLYLILAGEIRWKYAYTAILSEVVDAFKIEHSDQVIEPPAVQERGETTITDVEKATSGGQYMNLVDQWARGAFESFKDGHPIARSIAKRFKTRIA